MASSLFGDEGLGILPRIGANQMEKDIKPGMKPGVTLHRFYRESLTKTMSLMIAYSKDILCETRCHDF